MKKEQKRYIIRKYVVATNIAQALKKEKDASIEEVFIDEDWVKENPNFGFAE